MSKKYIAEVVNITDDKDKAGRSQVRVFGLHDDKINIPDKDLPWALPFRDGNNPSHNKIGTGGNGLLVGSHVFVEFIDDGKGNQIPYIAGSVPRGGEKKKGETTDGSTTVDTSKSDTPPQSRGIDKNPVVKNAITDSRKTAGTNSDDGVNIYDDITKKDAKNANLPTIGSNAVINGDILNIIKKIDPTNSSGIIKNAIDGLLKLKNIDNLTSPQGIQNISGQVLGNALGLLLKTNGQNTVFNKLNSIFAQSSKPDQYTFSEDQRIIKILQDALITLGNNIENNKYDVDVIDDITEIINEVCQIIHKDLKLCLEDNTLTKDKLIEIILQILTEIENKGQEKTIGSNNSNIMDDLSNKLPGLGVNITSTITDYLIKTVLDQTKINDALKKYTKSNMIMNEKENIIKSIFENTGIDSNKISKAIKGLIDPTNGKQL